jgi:hypothetical protein
VCDVDLPVVALLEVGLASRYMLIASVKLRSGSTKFVLNSHRVVWEGSRRYVWWQTCWW